MNEIRGSDASDVGYEDIGTRINNSYQICTLTVVIRWSNFDDVSATIMN